MRTGGASSSERNPAGRAGCRTTISFAWTTPTTPAFRPAVPEVFEGQTHDDGDDESIMCAHGVEIWEELLRGESWNR